METSSFDPLSWNGRSAAFIPTAGADVVQITVATPIPGSELYDRAKADGLLTAHDWDAFDFGSPTMLGQLPKPAMDALLHRAYLKTYMSGRFFRSLLSRRTKPLKSPSFKPAMPWWRTHKSRSRSGPPGPVSP